jgi:hypothetical protein
MCEIKELETPLYMQPPSATDSAPQTEVQILLTVTLEVIQFSSVIRVPNQQLQDQYINSTAQILLTQRRY